MARGSESTLADHLSLSLSLFFLLLYSGFYLIWRTAIHRLKACVVMETVSRCATSQLPHGEPVGSFRTEPSWARGSEWVCVTRVQLVHSAAGVCVIHNIGGPFMDLKKHINKNYSYLKYSKHFQDASDSMDHVRWNDFMVTLNVC